MSFISVCLSSQAKDADKTEERNEQTTALNLNWSKNKLREVKWVYQIKKFARLRELKSEKEKKETASLQEQVSTGDL